MTLSNIKKKFKPKQKKMPENHTPTTIITSALPYVNNQPHLGNIVGCVLSSDVYNRFLKKNNTRTIHICGTDEYGTATEIKALELEKHPREICDTNSKLHKEIYDWFNIEFDYFGRTSCKEHITMVQEIFQNVYDNGYFEEKTSDQFFCSACKVFLADRFVEGTCYKCLSDKAKGDQCDGCGILLKSTELVNPKCVLCKNDPILKGTKHLYLKLHELQDEISKFCEKTFDKWTHNSKEITKQWLNLGLTSRCMTRDLKYKWGVPVPIKDYEDKVFYVWFDAPIGYFTFLKQYLDEDYEQVIFNDNTKLYQFMGKDNVPFHSIVFPGILLATKKNYKLVDVISCTEYLMFQGEKFSKSRGVGIFGSDLIDNSFGPSCFWRYYLMKIRPETKDSNFSYSDFKKTITSDLINNIGNLVNRTLKFISKNQNGKVNYTLSNHDEKFIADINILYQKYKTVMSKCEIRNGIAVFLEISSKANGYVQEIFSLPENNNPARKCSMFSVAASVIYLLADLIEPFIPETSKKIFNMLNVQNTLFKDQFQLLDQDHKINNNISPIFNPFTKEQLKNLE
ncbi:methionine-tRNA ligase [Edhazardia aedis USNM 41457]|uniref:methionine--tRNA ligase n=1 Tax=Edhazardia aedis (strain USNM 41457) TaxID=1003232 RepID=J9DP79_EDHAE|nr:methionine-tRNA ligase [Edhazardia aedis USNM 41457]|eukprot:EJW04355.1 methionine-tRNA ligase [Edhazardia aedis USNM 41457]